MSGRAAVAAAILACLAMLADAKPAGVAIPGIGCPSDGQVGPVGAPRVEAKRVPLSPATAQRLAFYQGPYDHGIVGPRGWHCFELEGSNGSILFVAPNRPSGEELLSGKQGIDGPAIQLTERSGETSGRYEVAQMIARVFPAHVSFVKNVIELRPWHADEFPIGPYPSDRLTYHGDRTVEFVTPANAKGLGTYSRLLPNTDPILGVVMLDPDILGMSLLTMRLPKNMTALAPHITSQFMRDTRSQWRQ